ncbi:MAG: hypothetical protein AB1742_16135 [bacterium]
MPVRKRRIFKRRSYSKRVIASRGLAWVALFVAALLLLFIFAAYVWPPLAGEKFLTSPSSGKKYTPGEAVKKTVDRIRGLD